MVPPGTPSSPSENINNEILSIQMKDILSIFNPVLGAVDNHIRVEMGAMYKTLGCDRNVCVPQLPHFHEC
ncbi:MAG: hypothetical protein M1840_007715 [Geoglossum simile]|nr:MAG: hypothetical protein M1840_007715 [Geoglossum simile]